MKNNYTNYLFLFILFTFWPNIDSQDYFDFSDDILNQVVGNVKLRKCFCGTNEALYNSSCLDVGYTSVPLILFHDILEPILVNTSSFAVVENSGLKCGFGKYVTRIEPMNDFFVLSSGELLHVSTNTTYSPFEFCLDHSLTEDHELTWEIQMCIPTLNVPVCCPNERKNDGYCRNPYISIGFGEAVLKNTVINTVPIKKLQCSPNEKSAKAELSDPKNLTSAVYINYNTDSTQLVELSLDYSSPPNFLNENQYCIIPKILNKRILYEASFCAKDPLVDYQMSCKDKSCVRKCCPENNLYSLKDRKCIPYNDSFLWQPHFQRLNDSVDTEAPDNLMLSFGYPICKRSFYLVDPNKDKFILLDTGEMQVFQWNKPIPAPRYCMENFLTPDNKIKLKALTCFPDDPPEKSNCRKTKDVLIPILLILSCFFLLVTLIVYAWIPELHAKLHGKSLLSHVTSLFLAYLSLALVQLTSKKLPMIMCRIFGCLIQTTFLGSFFWLNVMCFDIWWTLRSMRPVAETSERTKKRFCMYSIYAWGCPIIIGCVTIGLEFGITSTDSINIILPGFGQKNCWFQDGYALWTYFYGFVLLLTILNIFFFGFVASILVKAQRANKGILRTTSKQHQERVSIYLKLFVVMGVTWICEIASYQEGSCSIWLIMDIVNALQGFFIFVIFICKKNIFKKLHKSGTDSTRRIRRMVQGSSSYGSSSQVTQQTSLDSTRKKRPWNLKRKLSSSLHYHLSKLNRIYTIEDDNKK